MIRSATRVLSRRVVLVEGTRTPFVKSFGELLKVDAIGLGVASIAGLIQKTGITPKDIDQIIWGNVVVSVSAPNAGREIAIEMNMPHTTAHTVSMACASGLKAITDAANAISYGDADCIIAGGSDSLSNAELTMPRRFAHGAAQFMYGPKHPVAQVKAFAKHAGTNPAAWLPAPPAIAERSTGKTMGFHADVMAELNKVARADQDSYAADSHRKALAARAKGIFKQEIAPVPVKAGEPAVSEDNMMREPDLNKLKTLKPAFRKKIGTITSGSSSGLTDGGSSVLLMSEEKAKQLNFKTDISIKSYAFCGIDPSPQLLLAPALAIAQALKKANLTMNDIDLFEIHEAFAAQVLATFACLQNETWCQTWLKQPAIGAPPLEKLNPNGGSLAIGHPFAATGGRVITSAMNELRRSEKRYALLSICAAGGLGGVAILERTADVVNKATGKP